MKKTILILTISLASQLPLSAQIYPDYPMDEPYFHEGHDSPNSPIAVTDGNPLSSTANAAAETSVEAAFLPVDTIATEFADDAAPANSTEEDSMESGQAAATTSGNTQSASIDIDLGMGSSTINGVDVDFYTVRIPYSRKINDRASWNLSIPVSMTNVKDVISTWDANGNLALSDAKVYGGGLNIGYSHKVFIKADGKPYRWKVTPSAGVFLRESSDLNQGSWVYNMGLSSSFAYQLKKQWVLNFGNSLSYSWNTGSKDYPDPLRDEQQVLVNGLQLFYLAGRWTYYGYVMDTRFIKNSLVDAFQTYAVGAGFRLTQRRSIKFSVLYDNGNGYESLRASIGSSWRF